MDVETIHLDADKRGNILCSFCGRKKAISAKNFRIDSPIKISCQCHHTFYIQFEQRQDYRKKVSLNGKFQKLSSENNPYHEILVEDISVKGAKFRVDGSPQLSSNDMVQLSIILDDLRGSTFTAGAIVRNVRDQWISVEFQELDAANEKLINFYLFPSTPASFRKRSQRLLHEKYRREAFCIESVQKDLERYFDSLDISQRPTFTGDSWHEAVKKFREYWENRYMCNHCHTITYLDNTVSFQYKCHRCLQGQLTNNPKEVWDIILKHSPQKETYFTTREAFSVFDTTIDDFIVRYPNGFLVPIRNDIYDNSVIIQVKDVYDEINDLGLEMSVDNLELTPTRGNIREIKKRNYEVNSEKITMGRSSDNDIICNEKNISRLHAYFYMDYADKKCYLIDAGSSNGTSLNKKHLTPNQTYELFDGDQISLGPLTKLTYYSSEGFYKLLHEIVGREDEKRLF
jgi:hypothetical protein